MKVKDTAENAKFNAWDIRNALSKETLNQSVSYDTKGNFLHTAGSEKTLGKCLDRIIELLEKLENK